MNANERRGRLIAARTATNVYSRRTERMTGTTAKPATSQPAAMPREGRVVYAKVERAEPTDKQIQLAMLSAMIQLAKSNGTHRGELESTVSFFA